MTWASQYIDKLKNGETVSFRPIGGSMSGLIESGQLCTVEPISKFAFSGKGQLMVGDIVLVKVNGSDYLHLIKKICDNQYQIGNNKGRINGWVELDSIFGVLVDINRE